MEGCADRAPGGRTVLGARHTEACHHPKYENPRARVYACSLVGLIARRVCCGSCVGSYLMYSFVFAAFRLPPLREWSE